jgi:hypothetical protein
VLHRPHHDARRLVVKRVNPRQIILHVDAILTCIVIRDVDFDSDRCN